MDLELLLENSIYKDATERATVLADKDLVKNLFWINTLGILALQSRHGNVPKFSKWIKDIDKTMIRNIDDKAHDLAIATKLAHEAGVITDTFTNEFTKLIYILKTNPNTQLDEDKLRTLFNKIVWSMAMPPAMKMRDPIKAWLDGKATLDSLIVPLYYVAKYGKNSNDFRSLTYYFIKDIQKQVMSMKGGVYVAPGTGAAVNVATSPVQAAVAVSTPAAVAVHAPSPAAPVMAKTIPYDTSSSTKEFLNLVNDPQVTQKNEERKNHIQNMATFLIVLAQKKNNSTEMWEEMKKYVKKGEFKDLYLPVVIPLTSYIETILDSKSEWTVPNFTINQNLQLFFKNFNSTINYSKPAIAKATINLLRFFYESLMAFRSNERSHIYERIFLSMKRIGVEEISKISNDDLKWYFETYSKMSVTNSGRTVQEWLKMVGYNRGIIPYDAATLAYIPKDSGTPYIKLVVETFLNFVSRESSRLIVPTSYEIALEYIKVNNPEGVELIKKNLDKFIYHGDKAKIMNIFDIQLEPGALSIKEISDYLADTRQTNYAKLKDIDLDAKLRTGDYEASMKELLSRFVSSSNYLDSIFPYFYKVPGWENFCKLLLNTYIRTNSFSFLSILGLINKDNYIYDLIDLAAKKMLSKKMFEIIFNMDYYIKPRDFIQLKSTTKTEIVNLIIEDIDDIIRAYSYYNISDAFDNSRTAPAVRLKIRSSDTPTMSSVYMNLEKAFMKAWIKLNLTEAISPSRSFWTVSIEDLIAMNDPAILDKVYEKRYLTVSSGGLSPSDEDIKFLNYYLQGKNDIGEGMSRYDNGKGFGDFFIRVMANYESSLKEHTIELIKKYFTTSDQGLGYPKRFGIRAQSDVQRYVFNKSEDEIRNSLKTADVLIDSDEYKTAIDLGALNLLNKSFKARETEFANETRMKYILDGGKWNGDKTKSITSIVENILKATNTTQKEKQDCINSIFTSMSISKKGTPDRLARLMNIYAEAKLFDTKELKNSVIPLPDHLDDKQIEEILAFNNFKATMPKGYSYSNKNDTPFSYVDRVQHSKFKIEEPKVTEIQEDEVAKERKAARFSKWYNNKHGDTGIKFIRSFDVHLTNPELEQWIKDHPNPKIVPAFHGTGSIAAAMILRFGFKVMKTAVGGVAVTGKMLGNGIYFADTVSKSIQYLGDSGYSRNVGTKGYLFEMEAYIGQQGVHYNFDGGPGSNIKSPEWCVFNGRDQLKIVRAHYVEIVNGGYIRDLKQRYPDAVNEAEQYSGFGEFLKEEMESKEDVINFVFYDGGVPDKNGSIVMFDDWYESLSEAGKNKVIISSGQDGPLVSIKVNHWMKCPIYHIPDTKDMIETDPDSSYTEWKKAIKGL